MPTRIIVQQVEKASLLIDNDKGMDFCLQATKTLQTILTEYVDIDNGIVIYLCFLKGAENDNLNTIVRKKKKKKKKVEISILIFPRSAKF